MRKSANSKESKLLLIMSLCSHDQNFWKCSYRCTILTKTISKSIMNFDLETLVNL